MITNKSVWLQCGLTFLFFYLNDIFYFLSAWYNEIINGTEKLLNDEFGGLKYEKIFNVVAFVCGMDEEYPYQIIRGINEYAKEHAINMSYFASFGGIVHLMMENIAFISFQI